MLRTRCVPAETPQDCFALTSRWTRWSSSDVTSEPPRLLQIEVERSEIADLDLRQRDGRLDRLGASYRERVRKRSLDRELLEAP